MPSLDFEEYGEKKLKETVDSFELSSLDTEGRISSLDAITKLRSEIRIAQTKKVDIDTIHSYLDWINSKCDSLQRQGIQKWLETKGMFVEMDEPRSNLDPYTIVERLKVLVEEFANSLMIVIRLREVADDQVLQFVDNYNFTVDDLTERTENAEKSMVDLKKEIETKDQTIEELKKRIEVLEAPQKVDTEAEKYVGLGKKDILRMILKENNIKREDYGIRSIKRINKDILDKIRKHTRYNDATLAKTFTKLKNEMF